MRKVGSLNQHEFVVAMLLVLRSTQTRSYVAFFAPPSLLGVPVGVCANAGW